MIFELSFNLPMHTVSSVSYDHQVHTISPNEFFFSRSQQYDFSHSDVDVYGSFWSFVFATIPPRGLRIRAGGEEREISGTVGILIPPDAVVHWKMQVPHLDWFAYCSNLSQLSELPNKLTAYSLEELPEIVTPLWIQNLAQTKRPFWYAQNSSANIYAKKLKAALDRDYQGNTSLDDYAQILGLSKEWLIRYFKQAYDITPIDYRNKKRLLQAFFELHTSSQKIIDLSTSLGFNDLKHFNSLFKKILQVTPSQLRMDAQSTGVS